MISHYFIILIPDEGMEAVRDFSCFLPLSLSSIRSLYSISLRPPLSCHGLLKLYDTLK